MSATDVFARRATLSRSVRLLSQFRFEQTDPARLDTALAEDTAAMVGDLWLATHRKPAAGLDPARCGWWSRLLRDGGSQTTGSPISASNPIPTRCTPDPRQAGRPPTSAPPAWRCPSPTPAWTSACRSNVAEHVPEPWRLAREMLRVTRPGGLAILSYTVWLGPFGGHEMGLTHYLGGARAAARYTRKHGHPAKNNYGSSLFAVPAADGLDFGAGSGALVAAFPRYHPRWAWWMTKVPLLFKFR